MTGFHKQILESRNVLRRIKLEVFEEWEMIDCMKQINIDWITNSGAFDGASNTHLQFQGQTNYQLHSVAKLSACHTVTLTSEHSINACCLRRTINGFDIYVWKYKNMAAGHRTEQVHCTRGVFLWRAVLTRLLLQWLRFMLRKAALVHLNEASAFTLTSEPLQRTKGSSSSSEKGGLTLTRFAADCLTISCGRVPVCGPVQGPSVHGTFLTATLREAAIHFRFSYFSWIIQPSCVFSCRSLYQGQFKRV